MSAAVLDAATFDAPPGLRWCRAWTAAVDGVLRSALARHAPDRGVALLALGSYARAELCPASDVDLLILHDGWRRDDLAALVQALCYPLWDAGLSVGHAVRTAKESVRAAGERIDTATALTDRRLIAGSGGLAEDLGARMRRWLRRQGGAVLSDLAAADARRHASPGHRPGLLEPDLKDGAGGLRDLHSLRWAAACVLGETGLDPLVGARYVSAADRAQLADAGALLLAARCALHLAQGRNARDVLRLDLQEEVAQRLGLPDGDVLMHRIGLAARAVAHVHGRTWAPLLADATQGRRRRRPAVEVLDDGIALVDGLVEVDGDRSLAAEPALGLRTVAAAAVRGRHLGRATSERLEREVAVQGALAWDDAARTALLATLRAGDRGVAALQDADHVGLLEAHLPGWERIRGRRQRNPYHRYDLDTHGLQAVVELGRLADGLAGPAHAARYAGLPDPAILLVGTLLHDVGKAWPGDHSEVGASIARDWVRHMGFATSRAEVVGRLVRHHLLLPDVATRRDIDDPDEVEAVARTVGDRELLDGLLLLTLADARATGPSAHSPWKDGLIIELHSRVSAVLAEDPAALSAAFDPLTAARAARRAARDEPGAAEPAALERLLVGLDDRYLLAASPAQCAAHAALIAPPPAPREVRAAWRPGNAEGTEVLSVVATDRLGFMAECAGVLAGRGLRVLDARAFTRAGGGGPDLALDWFVVSTDDPLDREGVVEDLARAAGGELEVADLIARREARHGVRPPGLLETPPVTVRVDVGEGTTRVEVHGPDAPGVLSRLAGVLAAAGLGVIGARVSTLGPQVRDVFFVRSPPSPPVGGWARVEAELRVAAGWPDASSRDVAPSDDGGGDVPPIWTMSTMGETHHGRRASDDAC